MNLSGIKLRKSHLNVAWVLVFLFFFFRIPQFLPVERVYFVFEAGFFIFLVLYLFLDVGHRVSRSRGFSRFEIYVLLLLVLPLQSALATREIFGQPVHLGVATLRTYFAIIGPLFILRALNRGAIRFGEVEKAFQILLWFVLGFYVFLNAYYSLPELKEMGYKVMHGGFKGAHLRVERDLAAFGFIYYFVATIRRPSLGKAAAVCIITLYILLLTRSRIVMVCSAGVLAVFFATRGFQARGRFLKYALLGFYFSLVPVLVIIIFPWIVAYLETGFGSAISVLLGEKGSDVSMNMRLEQFHKAVPYIQAHPWFGNGKISHYHEGGFSTFFGYFTPTDLGLIGLFYLFGIVGMAIFYAPWWYILNRWRHLSEGRDPVFLVAAKYMLVYGLMSSLLTGAPNAEPAVPVLWMCLLYAFIRLKQHAVPRSGRETEPSAEAPVGAGGS